MNDYQLNLKKPTDKGYYVMTYGGGRYTSIAWYKKEEQAKAHVFKLKDAGSWSGMPPKVEKA